MFIPQSDTHYWTSLCARTRVHVPVICRACSFRHCAHRRNAASRLCVEQVLWNRFVHAEDCVAATAGHDTCRFVCPGKGNRRRRRDRHALSRRFCYRVQHQLQRDPEVTAGATQVDSLRQRDHVSAAVFGSILSIALAVVYWLGRTGFTNPIRPVAVTAGSPCS
jgi:hypothetical protein